MAVERGGGGGVRVVTRCWVLRDRAFAWFFWLVDHMAARTDSFGWGVVPVVC